MVCKWAPMPSWVAHDAGVGVRVLCRAWPAITCSCSNDANKLLGACHSASMLAVLYLSKAV
jgi:hypothetical protein